MKKVLCTVLAVVMAVVCFAGCSAPAAEGGNEAVGSAASGDTIKVGLLGPYTGDLAVYGLAVKNGATLYFDKVNAEGGINGKRSSSSPTTTRAMMPKPSTPSTAR